MSNKIKTLQKKIIKARFDYYNGEATVTDQLFDAWVYELSLLDPDNYAITGIGSPISSEWEKEKHTILMGSLSKCNDQEGFEKWYSSGNLVLSEKLDGISINCVYENGQFIKALTRGDGEFGENIYSNVSKMIGIPKTINNFTGSIRGEIILTKELYGKYFSDKKNTRNAASGISKRLDGEGSEHLTVIFYMVEGNVSFNYEIDKFLWLRDNNCLTPNFKILNNVEEVMLEYDAYQEYKRESLGYDIDGLVITYNDIKYGDSLGVVNKKPNKSIAFKFDNVMVQTKLVDVIWQVGGSGRVSPVAIFEPVECIGAEINRATLHNVKRLKELGLYKGCGILISRRNDVIPAVEQRIDE